MFCTSPSSYEGNNITIKSTQLQEQTIAGPSVIITFTILILSQFFYIEKIEKISEKRAEIVLNGLVTESMNEDIKLLEKRAVLKNATKDYEGALDDLTKIFEGIEIL